MRGNHPHILRDALSAAADRTPQDDILKTLALPQTSANLCVMDHKVIEDILGNLLTHLGLPFTGFAVAQEDDIIRVTIETEKPSRLIGWRGETLNSLQHLVKSMLRAKNEKDAVMVVLDVDGYRLSQEQKVRSIAEQKAEFVRRTGNRIALSPMSPYFRRIVHTHVANAKELQDLTTQSVGQGDYRQVVLKLKEEKAAAGEELKPVMATDDGLDNLDI